MQVAIKRVAVDLTPILPGGKNGGAKVFIIYLMEKLMDLSPKTQFILLTHAASHAELAFLDRPNVCRFVVLGHVHAPSLLVRVRKQLASLAARLPSALSFSAYTIGARFYARLKRRSANLDLAELGADLLFCPFTAPTYFSPNIPTVCTVYDLQYKAYPQFFSPEDVAHRGYTFREACRRSSMLVAISEFSRAAALRECSVGPERIRTVPLRMARRICSRTLSPPPQTVRKGLGEDETYLVYPANYWKHKNHEMLLAAFSLLCRSPVRLYAVKLVFTGASDSRQHWLSRAANSMGLNDSVLFLGYVSDEDLGELIANSRGLVFPSLYEGFGLPVIEAMAAGVPVACSDITALPEVVGDAAILFDPRRPADIARALHSLISDTDLRTELIERGRGRAKIFGDGDRMAREYWEAFETAINNSRSFDYVSGLYGDGWVGETLQIQLIARTVQGEFHIAFESPDWAPHPEAFVHITCKSVSSGKLQVSRGQTVRWSCRLVPRVSVIEISITPSFVPAALNMGNDQRRLSLLVKSCYLKLEDGAIVDLNREREAV